MCQFAYTVRRCENSCESCQPYVNCIYKTHYGVRLNKIGACDYSGLLWSCQHEQFIQGRYAHACMAWEQPLGDMRGGTKFNHFRLELVYSMFFKAHLRSRYTLSCRIRTLTYVIEKKTRACERRISDVAILRINHHRKPGFSTNTR